MKETEDKDFLFTLADLTNLIKRSKKLIYKGAMIFGGLGILYALTKPIHYLAEGSFREKKSSASINLSTVASLFSSDPISSNDTDLISLLKSRALAEEVIKELHLQGQIEPENSSPSTLWLLWNNTKVTLSALSGDRNPLILYERSPLKLTYLNYPAERATNLKIDLSSDGTFDVLEKGSVVYTGRLSERCQAGEACFVLDLVNPLLPIPEGRYDLSIDTLLNTSSNLNKAIKGEPHKLDKNIVTVSYAHHDRHHASRLVNEFMEAYRRYLKRYRDALSKIQLQYLADRQSQLDSNLTQVMQKHADFLTNDLMGSGIVNSANEIAFLAGKMHEFRERLLNNELAIKRLEGVLHNGVIHHERFSPTESDSPTFKTMILEIRDLKQKRDWLEIEIQKLPNASQGRNSTFKEHMEELESVRAQLTDLHDVMDRFQQNLPPNLVSPLILDERFLLKSWFDRLDHLEREDEVKWLAARENFLFYLNNLDRLFHVHEKILNEKLTHQQNPTQEYRGIDLQVATELYLNLHKQLIDLDSEIKQTKFFIDQIADPNFEITSLSQHISDPIGQEIIRNAGHLVQTLRDQNNRTGKEQDRLKEDLLLQRGFLSMHLQQMIQLMELNKQFFEEKVHALQTVSVELIHQQISVLEQTLKDYVEFQLENLQEERKLFQEHLMNIRDEMKAVPKKWMAEQLIEQEVVVHKLIVEEVAKMVESKNIVHNLDLVQAAPLDAALPPIRPLTPPILLYGVLGAFLGGMVGFGVGLRRTFKNGLPASPSNLQEAGYQCAGALTPKADKVVMPSDMETLRKLENRFPHITFGFASTLVLLEGFGPDYSKFLAQLFSKQGKKVLRVYLDGHEEAAEATGLLAYLEGKVAEPTIHSHPDGDTIFFGGYSPFTFEMLHSERFAEWLQMQGRAYQWIIAINRLPPTSVAAAGLLPLFDNAVVTLKDESIEELRIFQHRANSTVFVFFL